MTLYELTGEPESTTLVELLKIFQFDDSTRGIVLTHDVKLVPIKTLFQARVVVELTSNGANIVKNHLTCHKGEIELGW